MKRKKKQGINIINLEGKEYALVPYELYNSMVEEIEDAEDIQEALLIQRKIDSGEMPVYSEEFVDRMLNGENLVKLHREHKGLTQAELAKKIGKSVAMIRKIESGQTEASVSTLKAIAVALDTDVDSLIR